MNQDPQVVETGTPHLLARREGRTLMLIMNRPEVRNALSDDMLMAMADQLAIAEADDAIGCVLLTGAQGAFCAGGDVAAMANMAADGEIDSSPKRVQWQRRLQNATAGRLFAMPKPTVAAINGPAAGAGFSLAMACDLRIMAEDTFLTTAFAKMGLSGDFGGTYFVTQMVGSAKAREFFMISDRIKAEEALRLNLINRVHPSPTLMDESLALAQRLASGPTLALGYMKENLNRALVAPATDCLDAEAVLHAACTETRDHKEAAAAFVQKRPPCFSGR